MGASSIKFRQIDGLTKRFEKLENEILLNKVIINFIKQNNPTLIFPTDLQVLELVEKEEKEIETQNIS